jgi:hypothetical protein
MSYLNIKSAYGTLEELDEEWNPESITYEINRMKNSIITINNYIKMLDVKLKELGNVEYVYFMDIVTSSKPYREYMGTSMSYNLKDCIEVEYPIIPRKTNIKIYSIEIYKMSNVDFVKNNKRNRVRDCCVERINIYGSENKPIVNSIIEQLSHIYSDLKDITVV